MSASGVGPFENDMAMDLADEVRGMRGEEMLAALRDALQEAVDVPAGDYLDRDLGEPAIAASAILLAKHQGQEEILETADLNGLPMSVPADFFPLVIAALERTLADDSEIRELWSESADFSKWMAMVNGLVAQARSAGG